MLNWGTRLPTQDSIIIVKAGVGATTHTYINTCTHTHTCKKRLFCYFQIYSIHLLSDAPIYIHIYFKMNRSTRGFVFELLTFLRRVFLSFYAFFRKIKWFVLVFLLIYLVATVFKRVWFFLIPGFVTVNFQFKLFVHDNFLSLQVLFLSSLCFFFSTRMYTVFLYFSVGAQVHACEHTYIFLVFLLLLFFPLKNLY